MSEQAMEWKPMTITLGRWIVLHDQGQATPAIGVPPEELDRPDFTGRYPLKDEADA